MLRVLVEVVPLRLMAGHQTLNLAIVVRVHKGQPSEKIFTNRSEVVLYAFFVRRSKMLRLLLVIVLLMVPATADARDVYVDGYYKRDGTYVQPHYRSAPDNNPYNNWSTKGNVNPYTGQRGYKNPTPNYGFGGNRGYGSRR